MRVYPIGILWQTSFFGFDVPPTDVRRTNNTVYGQDEQYNIMYIQHFK